MTVAINYDLGNEAAAPGVVYGMYVAIRDWLRAYMLYASSEKITLLIANANSLNDAGEVAASCGFDMKRLEAIDQRFVKENFARFSGIFRPDPDSRRLLWQRQQTPGPGFTHCGLAHAISGAETGMLLEQYCLSPSQAGDAIVCPSQAVRGAIRGFWDLYEDYLGAHFNTKYRCPVDLPVIPLGVDVGRFEKLSVPHLRATQRQQLGLADDDIAVLWVGRMSHALKGHPIAMFRAAERAAELSDKSIHLIMYGYFTPEFVEEQFVKLGAAICKKAKLTFISNKDPRFPDGLWAAGDIFLSLIDNMQESFGLTPIEAMAAGVPRVVSDWNGYRDGVTHGEDGFLVPTTQPPPGQGDALSALVLNGREMYSGFLAKTALSVAIDTDAAGQYIAHLAKNPQVRKQFSEKARARVREIYDWKNIIPRYENLWAEMSAKRHAGLRAAEKRVYPSVLPIAPDPYSMYAAFPTTPLKESDALGVIASPDDIQNLWMHAINTFGLDVMLPPENVIEVITFVRGKSGTTIGEVLQRFAGFDKAALWRTLGWLLKLGIMARKVS